MIERGLAEDGEGDVDLDALVAVGAANGIDVMARWGDRNVGQKRMNLGNCLRALLRKSQAIQIGDQRLEPPATD